MESCDFLAPEKISGVHSGAHPHKLTQYKAKMSFEFHSRLYAFNVRHVILTPCAAPNPSEIEWETHYGIKEQQLNLELQWLINS